MKNNLKRLSSRNLKMIIADPCCSASVRYDAQCIIQDRHARQVAIWQDMYDRRAMNQAKTS